MDELIRTRFSLAGKGGGFLVGSFCGEVCWDQCAAQSHQRAQKYQVMPGCSYRPSSDHKKGLGMLRSLFGGLRGRIGWKKCMDNGMESCNRRAGQRGFASSRVARLTEEEKRAAFMRGVHEARNSRNKQKELSVALYATSGVIATLALAYASVPLYRVICQRTGWGGTPITDNTKFTADKLVPVDRKKRITVNFSSEVSTLMPWKFRPQQRQVQVLPGETALAFYKAKNTSDRDIIGMATYSVVPDRAAAYFNKIQCFCFEEQQLRPGEEVDMPVFFFIDPDFAKDPAMANIDDIVLHYTFFKAQYNDQGNLTPVSKSDST